MDSSLLLEELFREEARDQLQKLRGLLTLEPGQALAAPAEAKRLSEIARALHGLKGAALSVGGKQVGQLCHDWEELVLSQNAEQTSSLWPEFWRYFEELEAKIEAFRFSELPAAGEAPSSSREPSPDSAPAELEPGATRDTVLRVKVESLDSCLHQLEELVLEQESLRGAGSKALKLARRLQAQLRQRTDIAEEVLSMMEGIVLTLSGMSTAEGRQLQLSNYLRQELIRLRVLPLERLSPQLRQTARTAADTLGKDIKFELELSELQIDSHLLHQLNYPLEHLIRNAIDHGIEDAETRLELGKPESGLLRLSARMSGQSVELLLEDDGRGLNEAAIVRKAKEAGLLSAEQAARLGPHEIWDLIFLPGLSTAVEVSELSGRGIGLDSARATLERLGGSLKVLDTSSRGTSFLLRLPAYLLTTPCLVFRSEGTTYCLHEATIERLVRVHQCEQIMGQARGLISELGWVELATVSSLLKVSACPVRPGSLVLVLSSQGRKIGLLVEELLGSGPQIVQPMPAELAGLRGVHGVVLLPDGEVALALEPTELMALSSREGPVAQSARPSSRRRRILVVDDSAVVRALTRDALRQAGYEVKTAEDGEEALSILQTESFQLLVSDVQMPGLDGISLTRHLRASEEWAELPIVLVTTRSAEADIREGAEAGANAYVVKGELAQAQLLSHIRRLLP